MKKLEVLPRRTFLRGAGSVLIGLPFLEAMLPTTQKAWGAAGAVKKLFIVYSPNGENLSSWDMNGSAFPSLLSSLNPVRDYVTVLRNVNNKVSGNPYGDGHGPGIARFLTCQQFVKSSSAANSPESMDQIIARSLGTVPYYLTGPYEHGGANGVAGEYFMNISYVSPRAATRLNRPSLAFARLFGAIGPDPTPTPGSGSSSKQLATKSILDFAKADAAKLNGKLGMADRAKLDEYLTGVREVEKRIGNLTIETFKCTAEGGAPSDPSLFADHTTIMFSLALKALQCSPARVVSYSLDPENTHSNVIGLGNHHDNSHAGNAAFTAQNAWFVAQWAKVLEGMKATSDGPGQNLLDTSLSLFGNGMQDHQFDKLCMIMAGKGGGTFSPIGGSLDTKSAKLSGLHLKIMNSMGLTNTSFGDSSGVMQGV